MTLIELLVVLLVIAVIAILVVPAEVRGRTRAQRIRCNGNLKCVGIAFRIWEGDHDDRYPMSVSMMATNGGGTLEYVGSAKNTFRHFEIMSNELNTPKILFCPADTEPSRRQATMFGRPGPGFPTPPSVPPPVPFTANSNLSYFVGVDAADIYPQMFLSGDRNLTNGLPPVGGLVTLTTNRVTVWTDAIHRSEGNIAFADGSVQGLKAKPLQSAVANTGFTTNRLAMP